MKNKFLDCNKNEIGIGSIVIMPSPDMEDNWNIGGWKAVVVDVLGGSIIVEELDDESGETYMVEPEYVELDTKANNIDNKRLSVKK